MAATIRRLMTRRDAERQREIETLRQALLPFRNQLPDVVGKLLHHVDQSNPSRTGWTFIMIDSVQHDAVVEWLDEHSQRPRKALRLWSLVFRFLCRDTGQVLLTRHEIANRLEVEPRHVSEIMGELVKIGAIVKKRDRAGVGYFLNPCIGTHLAGAARDVAQAKAPHLHIAYDSTVPT